MSRGEHGRREYMKNEKNCQRHLSEDENVDAELKPKTRGVLMMLHHLDNH